MSQSATPLLVMDFQRGVADRYDETDVVARAAEALAAARVAGVPVIFVRVAFRPGHPEVSASNRSFAALRDARGLLEDDSAIHPALGPLPGEPIVTKRRVSAFAGSDLDVLLRALGARALVLCGIATSGVVLSTLRAAVDLDFELTVLRDACADADPEVHRILLDRVFPRQADVVDVASWSARIGCRATGAVPGGPGRTVPSYGARDAASADDRIMTSRKATAASADPTAAAEDRELKARQRASWALGDYHRFASESIWGFGSELVAACGITAGQRVLDVAAGSGNVAIRAAEAGAQVIASDLTPENFEAGRREARARGVELDWVEADAEALPFGAGEFDVVTSAVGAIFAPHHQTVADELLRVCRPSGTIGMIAIVPSGFVVDLFKIMERYSRSAPVASMSTLQWGREEHAREMFGDRVEWLELRREGSVLNRFEGPAGFVDYFTATHPLMVALRRDLADEPARVAALDRELLQAATHGMSDSAESLRAFDVETLLIVARKRG